MPTGTLYSYTDTSNNVRTIADVINMIDWTEAPLLRLFGFGADNVRKFDLVGWPGTKVELNEDTMPAYETLITEAIDNSELGFDVTNGTGVYFRTGDIVGVRDQVTGQIDEKGIVDSSSANEVTLVARGYGNTSATTHASGDTLVLLIWAMFESADYTMGFTTTLTQFYNYTQIISEAVKASKTGQKISKYGIDDYMDYHVAKLFADNGSAGKLAQLLQRIWYYGERVQRTNSDPGSAGGFETFVTSNVIDLNGSAIDRTHIHTIIRNIRQAGGKVTHLVTGAWGMEKLMQMYEGSRRTTQDSKLGGSEIDEILTPHGRVKLVYDWMCPQDRYYFVNGDKVGWLPLREFDRGTIAEQGDYHVTDVVGEYTFLVANEKSHGIIKEASVIA